MKIRSGPMFGIPNLLKECKAPANVLLHLMFLRKQEPLHVEELWAQQKGVTKWSLQNVRAALHRMEAIGLTRSEQGGWTVGPAFDPADDSKAAQLAQRLVDSYDKPGIVEKVTVRHDAIADVLAVGGRHPITAKELFDRLQGSSHQNLRTLQRDLVELEKRGLVSRNDEGWMAGPELRDDRFEDRARAAALKLLADSFASAVPQEIQFGLVQPLKKARKRLDSLPPEDPRNRWIEAFRLTPGHLELDDPVVAADIKDAVEDSILQRTKIQLTGREVLAFDTSRAFSFIGSISHFLLEMPARPAIIFWPDGMDRPRRIRLQDIQSAESVNAVASWPRGYEPEPIQSGMGFYSGDHAAHGGRSLFVLRASDDALRRMKSRRIGNILKEVRSDGEGWTIVSFRALGNAPLYEYLRDLAGVVVLRPFWFWKFAQMHHRNSMRNYQDAADLVRQYKLEEDRELDEPLEGQRKMRAPRSLEAITAPPRFEKMPTIEAFTANDEARLQVSTEWKLHPEVMESLCRLFHEYDPMNISSGENPHALTEYLFEAESIVRQVAEMRSAEDLAIRLEGTFAEMFSGEPAACDWAELAKAMWPILDHLA